MSKLDSQKLQKWLESEIVKDKIDLNKDKNELISRIKRVKKEDIIPKKTEQKHLSLWQRIKKVLMG